MTSDRCGQINNVLLLGATGRLGGMLRRHWPTPADLRCQSRQARPGFLAFDPLVQQRQALASAQGVAAVICLSGITPVTAAAGVSFDLNSDLALAAIDLAGCAGVPRVFVASSAAVYGRALGALSEGQQATPVSDYGTSKLAMEQAARAAAQKAGVALTILRIGNVAGADAIVGGWRAGMQIDQFADGSTPRRSYIGPVTLARVLHHLTRAADLPEVLNIAAPGTVEMGALLDAAGLAWRPRPATQGAIAQVALDTKALERHVDFAADSSTPAGIVAEWRRDCDLQT